MLSCIQVNKMLKQYEWIGSEKHLFGQPNTNYDFKANDPDEAREKLQNLQEKNQQLEKNVNVTAMNMLSEAEERVSVLCINL